MITVKGSDVGLVLAAMEEAVRQARIEFERHKRLKRERTDPSLVLALNELNRLRAAEERLLAQVEERAAGN